MSSSLSSRHENFFSSDEYIELFSYLNKNGIDMVIENRNNLEYIEKVTKYILYSSDDFIEFRNSIKLLLIKKFYGAILPVIK